MIRLLSKNIENGMVFEKYTKDGSTVCYEVSYILDDRNKIKVEADKQTISADGLDTATITATVFNYLGEEQTTFAGDLVFEFDGQQTTIQAVDGKASITFDSAIAGTFTIKTAVDGFRNGEVEVTAV